MGASATFSLDGIGRVVLAPGELIGRRPTAALFVDDPRVSEAHAMVSLRRGELYLLSLRRMISHRGRPVSEVWLDPGVIIELAHGLELTVEEVARPDELPALESEALGRQALGPVASVVTGPPLRLAARFVTGAAAHLWSVGEERWRLRIDGARARELRQDDSFTVDGHRFRLCTMPLASAGQPSTQGAGGIAEPLAIDGHYDTVVFRRPARPPVTIGGVGARLLSELIAIGGPVSWEVVARELWTGGLEASELRRRWDVTLHRLRGRLRDEGLRTDLLHSDGGGQVQLVLYPGDMVDDRS